MSASCAPVPVADRPESRTSSATARVGDGGVDAAAIGTAGRVPRMTLEATSLCGECGL